MQTAQHLGAVKRTDPISLLEVTATASARIARAPAAGNDERFSGAAHTDVWAQRAAAANGFGDAVVAPSAYALMHAARGDRSRGVSAAIVDLACRVARAVTVAVAAWRARRLAHATSRALAALDAHMLRDIGLDRSELASVGAEVAGLIARHRVHALR